MSEPGAGTDVKAMKTKAVQMDGAGLYLALCAWIILLSSEVHVYSSKQLLYAAYPP